MKNVFKFFGLSALLMCFALFAGSAAAQSSTTGSIEGTVTDANGASVPGASVKVTSPNLISAQTATTDDSGRFRVLNLPPGKYAITIEADKGFAKAERTEVEVNLSKTSTVDLQLQPAGAQATVTVTDTAGAAVDVSGVTTGSNVSSDQFSNFPTQRTVQGLYTIAPTVTRSGLRDATGRDRDPSVAGSSGPENSYILDGVNTTDPAFGGGGANLPFEFVQEVQIKTGAFGADQGLSTGGVFNVITKTGGNEFHGDVFAYGLPKNFVRDTKNFPFVGLAPNGYSELDAGVDVGGPIIKDRLTFFAAFNPQFRTNSYLTQTFRKEVEGKIKTPFYSGKLSWLVNNNNTLTFSTFGDFTKEEGHLFAGSGFGSNLNSFVGVRETGGHNYAARLNSNVMQNMIGEFSFGLHFQQNNITPDASVANTRLAVDNFAILRSNGTVSPVTQTLVDANAGFTSANIFTAPNSGRTGFVDYVFSPGGTLQRNFVRNGFGLFQEQTRDRWEAAARLQNIYHDHTFKYGFEFYRNSYDIFQTASGGAQTFANPYGLVFAGGTGNNVTNNARVTNNYFVCTTRTTPSPMVVCPTSNATNLFNALPVGSRPTGFTANAITASITQAEFFNNPFLIRNNTRVRNFELNAQTRTDVESFYIQDDWRVAKNLQFNLGVRWDYQQSYGNEGQSYLKLNDWFDNLQPRIGFSWDPWGHGKTKLFANYARFVETPIPLDVNVRAGSENSQTDKNFQVDRLDALTGAVIIPGIRALGASASVTTGAVNLGAEPTPIDAGLKPQTVNDWTIGVEHQFHSNYTVGARGIYRAQGSVIEDGSFDDGDSYFLFNPGESVGPGPGGPLGNTEYNACLGDPSTGRAPQCFGHARRFYRALEFTLSRRFANNYAFQASYVFSSLTGNYEGLFRNDNGQSDPNITSLFDLTSLLANTYGRLPNDRPHQLKFNGTYQTPWRLVVSGNFYIQSGIPFNQLIPHPVYGNNEGFAVPRGTAIIPDLSSINGNGGISSAIGKNRTPTTWNLDLGAYYPIKFSENMQLRLTADWFNVTNSQRAVTLDQTFQINSGATGVPPVPNPFFGSGTIFQYPSAIRLGAKFSF